MKALFKLTIYKNIGFFRNIFSKKISAIFSVALVLFYGFLFVISLNDIDTSQIYTYTKLNQDLSSVVMLVYGIFLIYIISLLMNKHTALFTQEDAFYLFSGPFTNKQIFKSLYSKSVLSAILISLFNLVIFVMYKAGIYCSGFFYVLFFLVFFLMSFTILILVDYLYLLRITNVKNKILSKVIVAILFISIAIVFLISYYNSDYNLSNALKDFVISNNVYFIPIIGYGKMILSSYILNDYKLVVLGFALLLFVIFLLYYMISHFKGEYKSQVLDDAVAFSAIVKKVKNGKRNDFNQELKSKNATIIFKPGAKAIYSKNLLLIKKTRSYFNTKLIIPSILYIVLAKYLDLGFMFFVSMNLFLIFSIINNSDLVSELKNYQIYLIPDSSFKKLIAIIIIPFIQVIIYTTLSMILAEIVFQINFLQSISYILFVYGFVCVFFSGSILSLRVFKSANNLVFEMFIRMFVLILASIPAIAVIIYLAFNNLINNTLILAISTFITNVLVALLILYFCQDITNGKGINAD